MGNRLFKNPVFALLLVVLPSLVAFWHFFILGQVPLPGDFILGTYYPWIDQRWDHKNTIFPVLNPTIYDSITSFYPWKVKVISAVESYHLPLIDESSFLGHPLFESGTSGVLYPLNILFLFLPFNFAWSLLVSLTPILSGLFFYFWIRNRGVCDVASICASVCYSFSAFMALQVTFINSPHSVLWLPLALLSIDKLLIKFSALFYIILIFALFSSLNAGFYQGSLYLLIFSFTYLLYFSIKAKKNILYFSFLVFGYLLALMISGVQLIPFISYLLESNRLASYKDQASNPEIFNFFVEPKYLLTTIITDFFGNPGKWNYWGKANYYEFNNFSGSLINIGLIISLVFVRFKDYAFYVYWLVVALILVTPNPVSEFPYLHSWPIISSLTPSRILLLVQFCLITISAYGLDKIFKKKSKIRKVTIILVAAVTIFGCFVVLLQFLPRMTSFLNIRDDFLSVALRNSAGSFIYFFLLALLVIFYSRAKWRILIAVILIVSSVEVIRQSSYFRPFIQNDLVLPKTSSITFLEKNSQGFRFMITDQRLLPVNTQSVFDLRTIDGDSPVFPNRLNQFMTSINSTDNSAPFTPKFSRVIFFTNYQSPMVDVLNIKYVLSLKQINNPKFLLAYQDGDMKVYENMNVLSKFFLTPQLKVVSSDSEVLRTLKDRNYDLHTQAITSSIGLKSESYNDNQASVTKIRLEEGRAFAQVNGAGILVYSEQYLPGWQAFIDGHKVQIFPVDFDLMGMTIPQGIHNVELSYKPDTIFTGEEISALGIILLLMVMLLTKLSGKYMHFDEISST